MWKIKAGTWRQEIKQSPLRLSLHSYFFYVSLMLNLTKTVGLQCKIYFFLSFFNKLMKESHRGQWSHNTQQTEKRDLQWRQESQKAEKWVTSLGLGEGGSKQIESLHSPAVYGQSVWRKIGRLTCPDCCVRTISWSCLDLDVGELVHLLRTCW